MTKFFLRIYDFLVHRKSLALALMVALAGACLFLASRLGFEEDISKFLPSDPESARYQEVYNAMGAKNNIIILFRPGEGTSRDDLMDAVDTFEAQWRMQDTDGHIPDRQLVAPEDQTLDMVDFIGENIPYFLCETDYARIDSLLALPGYVADRLAGTRRTLMYPTGDLVTRNLRSDPLGLFTPVLERLAATSAEGAYEVEDGYLFTKDGTAVGFMTSPYGASESGDNGLIAALVASVADSTMAQCPGVLVSAVGSPLVAATNAERIKKDSILAVGLAMALICLLLALTFKRFSDIFNIAVSVAAGWIFAVAVLALTHGSMSIIVLGIGSIIIGIAVNYPLHFMDGLKSGTSPRENLAEMVQPLLIGNITTVAAFLCLAWMDAAAMRDLGLFGSLMLVGTILFVLVFLPLISRPRPVRGGTLELGRILPDEVPSPWWLTLLLVAVTVFMAAMSRRTGFDSDMSHINYMTAQQRADFALMEGGVTDGPELYAVATGATLDEAMEANDALLDRIDAADAEEVKGAGRLLPGRKRQEKLLSMWEDFKARHGSALKDAVARHGSALGFSSGAFDPFNDLLDKDFTPQGSGFFAPVAAVFEGPYVMDLPSGKYILSRVRPSGDREAFAESLRGEGSFVFGAEDVGNRLVRVLSDSFDWILYVCSLVVFVFLCLSFRRLELAILAFLPLAVGWYWILGTMGLLGLSFNIVNVILATFIFGQGDDYTIFITEGLLYEYAYGRKRLATYKNSVFHSAVIMFIGIGTLILARHPAMRSLAEVTIVGMFMVVVFAWWLPPVVFRWLTTRKGAVRDIPLTLKRLLYSAFALVFFVLFIFLVFYPYTFLHFLFRGRGEESKLLYHRCLQKLSRFLVSHVPGVGFSVSNPAGETFEKPSLIICNHQSHLDTVALMALSPRIVFIMNDWAWNNPLYRYIVRNADFLTISDDLASNLDRILDLVRRGYSIVVFPEGTRTMDGKVGRFHRGGFFLASQLGLDIVPVMIHGAWHVLPKNDFMLREGKITLSVGERTATSGDDYRALAKQWRRYYAEEYPRLCREIETPSYLATYVRYKYIYKGPAAERLSRKVLRGVGENPLFGRDFSGTEAVLVRNCGQGEIPFILALMYPELEVWATDPDPDNLALASNLSCLPRNLHFAAGGFPPAEEIDLN